MAVGALFAIFAAVVCCIVIRRRQGRHKSEEIISH